MEQLIEPGTEEKLAQTPGIGIVRKRRMAAISVDDLAGASSTDKKISKMAPMISMDFDESKPHFSLSAVLNEPRRDASPKFAQNAQSANGNQNSPQ